jgi:hypothetical protein
MKYQFSEEYKNKAVRQNQMWMTIYYGIGTVIIAYKLLSNWAILGIEIKSLSIGGLIILPFVWLYFDKKFKSKISSVYEIIEESLIISENGVVTNNIPLNSIRQLIKIPNGYRVESYSGNAFILNGIENIDELVKRIDKPCN